MCYNYYIKYEGVIVMKIIRISLLSSMILLLASIFVAVVISSIKPVLITIFIGTIILSMFLYKGLKSRGMDTAPFTIASVGTIIPEGIAIIYMMFQPI